MKNKQKFGVVAALLLVIPSLAQAQRAAHAMAPVGRAAAQTPSVETQHSFSSVRFMGTANNQKIGNQSRATTVSARHNSNSFTNSFGFGVAPLSVQNIADPVPGFGFNYEHLNTINQDLGIRTVIDPATQRRLAVRERLPRERPTFPGFWLLDGGGGYVESPAPAETDQEQPQPQVMVPDQAPEAQEPAPQEAPQDVVAAPLPDEGQFTLVLRDGTKIEAIAFTHARGNIVYITPDGWRQTLAVSDLDSDATLRVNQQRGTPLQLPL